MWEEYLEKAHEASKGIKPLVINTSIHQLVQEELSFLVKEVSAPISTQGYRDLFEGLRKVIILENLLIHLGLNPIYLPQVHEELERLKNGLKPWYANHLNLQSLTHFIGQHEAVSKKYLDWVKELTEEKKMLTSSLEKQALSLLRKVGG
jgi:predicted nucleic acid-binding protein